MCTDDASSQKRPQSRKQEGNSPIVLDVQVLGSDGRVDAVVQALGRRYLVVGWPGRRVGVDDGLVDVAPGVRPVARTRRRAAPADHQGAAVVLDAEAEEAVAPAREAHRQAFYQGRLVRELLVRVELGRRVALVAARAALLGHAFLVADWAQDIAEIVGPQRWGLKIQFRLGFEVRVSD